MASQNKNALLEIERLLKRYRSSLSTAADTIRDENVSNYPIFVASKTAVEIGVELFSQGQLPDKWIVMASSLEEFHVRKIINSEKIDDFRNLYRTHPSEICVFVVDTEAGSQFIFIPS
jgi:hypothetical protein